MDKETIRTLYDRLYRVLAQTHVPRDPCDRIEKESVWKEYNESVNTLADLLEADYRLFLIDPPGAPGQGINTLIYREKLRRLLFRLHDEHFPEEPAPFSRGPWAKAA